MSTAKPVTAPVEVRFVPVAIKPTHLEPITDVATPLPDPTPSPTPEAPQIVSPQASGGDSGPMMYIFMHESGNNPEAVNPTSGACGLGQALPCGKLTAVCNLSDYNCQVQFFTLYADERYGGWDGAAAFWSAHAWW